MIWILLWVSTAPKIEDQVNLIEAHGVYSTLKECKAKRADKMFIYKGMKLNWDLVCIKGMK